MVGVAVKGKSVLGVIHKPFSLETFWAVDGHGMSPTISKLLQERKDRSSVSKPGDIKVVVSRSHAGTVTNLTQAALASLGVKPEIITSAGAGNIYPLFSFSHRNELLMRVVFLGYKVLEVVRGKADAYVHATHIKKWDLCAGDGILKALGGTMTTLNGQTIDYSPESDPKNTGGLLAYVSLPADIITNFQSIKIPA